MLDGLAQGLVAEGKLGCPTHELPFADRLIAVCEESGRNFPQEFDFSLPQTGIRPIRRSTSARRFSMLANSQAAARSGRGSGRAGDFLEIRCSTSG
ncbi:MAG: hypothetical protein U0232_15850 [Thermomicrobiales bacterium]